jgi:hypothetical protein
MTTLRLRTDNWHDAGHWRAILLGAAEDPRKDPSRWDRLWPQWIESHEEAKVGDVWRIRQQPHGPHVSYGYGESHPDWPISGYALVCPVSTCREGAHMWLHAYDCPAGSKWGQPCKRGPNRWSCWDWSGSVEAGDLTAAPSLMILPCPNAQGVPTTCQFHGFLTRGVLA